MRFAGFFFAAVAVALAIGSSDALLRPANPTTHRSNRGIVGGQVEIPVDSDDVKPLLEAVFVQLNRESNSMMKIVPVTVAKVTRQVVAGLLYRISFSAGLSRACIKDEVLSTTEQCPVLSSSVHDYSAEILVQVWMKENPVKIISITPLDSTVDDDGAPGVPGGKIPVDVQTDASAKRALEFALSTASSNVQATAPGLQLVAKEVRASKQLVNGLVYEFDILAVVRAENSKASGAQERVSAKIHEALGEVRPLNVLAMEHHAVSIQGLK
eukprot:Opistho-2@76421